MEPSEDSSEGLDFTSEHFDPLKALNSDKTVVPVPNAPVYDNIAKYESVSKGIIIEASKVSRKMPQQHRPSSDKQQQQNDDYEKRLEKAISLGRNVIIRMENVLGPLQLLHNCMETKTKIKVYTRDARGVRGYIEAFVAAFDKHWNLALQDCLEVWTRKIKRKAPAMGNKLTEGKLLQEIPKTIVRNTDGVLETLERHLPQILLRGEQIVTIIKLN